MITSVKQQDMFSYSVAPLWIVGGLLLALLIYFGVDYYLRNKSKFIRKVQPPKVLEKTPETGVKIQEKYLQKLFDVELCYKEERYDTRTAYQQMSEIIRDFVYEITGIQVPNYTLMDIKGCNMPVLEELIQEYYSPEFALEAKGDVLQSLEKTKSAIERW